MDVFELLKEDHARLKVLLQDLEDTLEREVLTRDHLFLHLKTELTLHAECEETYLYPILSGSRTTEAMVLESNVAHKLAKTLLAELDAEPKDTIAWSAKLKVLGGILRLQVQHEEWELFPKARLQISEEDAEAIALDIEAFKAEALLLQLC
ncbi:MAG: hemerythrin domain-containing protein [Fibrobacteria bacterium]